MLVEIVVPVGANLQIGGKRGAARVQKFVGRALQHSHVAGEPNAGDGNILRLVLVEAERLSAPWQRTEAVDPLDHAADQGDIPIELARAVADHGVKLAAGSRVRSKIASDTNARVTMSQVRPTSLGAVGDRPAIGEARPGCVGAGASPCRNRKV